MKNNNEQIERIQAMEERFDQLSQAAERLSTDWRLLLSMYLGVVQDKAKKQLTPTSNTDAHIEHLIVIRIYFIVNLHI